ncbi:hypothetical protein [Flavobacterium sp.]|uniref:hypothetical protein n=1 Tax=Flavobacterium sp. TaxID=239 RepID=UPI00286DC7F1|nr:hypothetical protein [Flavobacterium sp.]
MKKVIFSISVMLCSMGAFAQSNSSDVFQIGTSQWADVDQDGLLNVAKIRQGVLPGQSAASNNNYSEIDQDGARNNAFTSQSNLFNDAYQEQIGSDNQATIWQDQLVPNVSTGYDFADQQQHGDNNKATVDQGTSGNNPLPSTPVFSAAAVAFSNAVPVPVSPHGDNDAYQHQDDDYGIAYVSQGGKRNYSRQYQNGSASITAATANESNHYQYGNDNDAISVQWGKDLTVNSLQIGNDNYTKATQMGTGHNSVNVQVGNSNYITVLQND